MTTSLKLESPVGKAKNLGKFVYHMYAVFTSRFLMALDENGGAAWNRIEDLHSTLHVWKWAVCTVISCMRLHCAVLNGTHRLGKKSSPDLVKKLGLLSLLYTGTPMGPSFFPFKC